jgi:hypothetical protein
MCLCEYICGCVQVIACVRPRAILTALPQDEFQVDVADPRFASLYNSRDFAIDPTDPAFMCAAAHVVSVPCVGFSFLFCCTLFSEFIARRFLVAHRC